MDCLCDGTKKILCKIHISLEDWLILDDYQRQIMVDINDCRRMKGEQDGGLIKDKL